MPQTLMRQFQSFFFFFFILLVIIIIVEDVTDCALKHVGSCEYAQKLKLTRTMKPTTYNELFGSASTDGVDDLLWQCLTHRENQFHPPPKFHADKTADLLKEQPIKFCRSRLLFKMALFTICRSLFLHTYQSHVCGERRLECCTTNTKNMENQKNLSEKCAAKCAEYSVQR